MKMIEIVALENGAHRNQTFNGVLPDGWAIILDGMETENFPFGEVTAEEVIHYWEKMVEQAVTKTRDVVSYDEEGSEIITTEEYTEIEMVMGQEPYRAMTVTKWVAGEIPNPDNGEDADVGYIPTPTLRYRVTALEESMASLEDALCEMDAANAEAIASIEDALCELDI